MEAKIISISENRQITIPKEYFDKLNLGSKAECFFENDSIIIRPFIRYEKDFSQDILKELVSEGYTGQELLDEFGHRTKEISYAIEKLKEEGEKIASGNIKGVTYKEIFGEE